MSNKLDKDQLGTALELAIMKMREAREALEAAQGSVRYLPSENRIAEIAAYLATGEACIKVVMKNEDVHGNLQS